MCNAKEALSRHGMEFNFNFTDFNKVQARCVDILLGSDSSVVVSAPTGSGKTVLMVLAILRLFKGNRSNGRNRLKAVYIAPIKALAYEKACEWEKDFAPLGIRVQSITGDTEGEHEDHIQHILSTDIIITTPEKFDSVTRRWREAVITTCVRDIGLILLDEVHLLAERRGTVLEALVSRMKTIRSAHQRSGSSGGREAHAASHLRFVAISATMSNAPDIGDWLCAPRANVITFSPTDRPVPLGLVVLSYQAKTTPFVFEKYLTYKIPNILVEYGQGKPALIFCHTRRAAALTAVHIAQNLSINTTTTPPVDIPSDVCNKQLIECLKKGTAFHHAGLMPAERTFVEQLFFGRKVLILCTTSTLALGVNLPARLVVIKGTAHFVNGKTEELTSSMVMQMAGRAGRAGLDDKGVAVILTSNDQKARLQQVATEANVVESKLGECNIEHVNAEIVLRTINTSDIVMEWFRTTFFWIRVHSNPSYYGYDNLAGDELDTKLHHQADHIIANLVAAECVTMQKNGNLEATRIGKSMARNYLSYKSVYVIHKHCAPSMTISDVLEVISKCGEFEELRLRQGEKKLLNDYNKKLRHPLMHNGKQKNVSESWHKVYILIQCWVQEVTIDEWSIKNDQGRVVCLFPRLLRHLIECGDAKEHCLMMVNGYSLLRSVKRKMWESGELLRQLEGVGSVMSSSLGSIGITTFNDLKAADACRIEQVTGRAAPFGINIKSFVSSLPTYTVTYKAETLTLHKTSIGAPPVACVVLASTDSDKLVCHRRVPPDMHTFTAHFPVPSSAITLKTWIVNDMWLGIDTSRSFQLRTPPPQAPTLVEDSVVPVSREPISSTPSPTSAPLPKQTKKQPSLSPTKPNPTPKGKVKPSAPPNKPIPDPQEVHLKMLQTLNGRERKGMPTAALTKFQLPLSSDYEEREKGKSVTPPTSQCSVSASSLSFGFQDRTPVFRDGSVDPSEEMCALDFDTPHPQNEPPDILGLDIDFGDSDPVPEVSEMPVRLPSSKRRRFDLGLESRGLGMSMGVAPVSTQPPLPEAEKELEPPAFNENVFSEAVPDEPLVSDEPLLHPKAMKVQVQCQTPPPVPSAVSSTSASSHVSLIDQLAKLTEMVTQGFLSKEEFQSAKRLLLKMDCEPSTPLCVSALPEPVPTIPVPERVLHPSVRSDRQVVNKFNIKPKPFKPLEQNVLPKNFEPELPPAVHWDKRPPPARNSSSPEVPSPSLTPPRHPQKGTSFVSDFLEAFSH